QGSVAAYAVGCECRKRARGLSLEEGRRRGIDLTTSWLIGDILDDVEAGHRAGCRTVLVNRGSETAWVLGPGRVPDHVAPDFLGAAEIVAAQSEHSHSGSRSSEAEARTSP